MRIENSKRAAKLRKTFFIGSVIIAVAALVLFLLDLILYGIIGVGVFAFWFLYFQVSDFQYIQFSNENNKIVLRYYKIIRFGNGEYNSIEFPQNLLQNAYFENSVFGKMSDLTLIIKTKRGIAEYPSVSLTAIPIEQRKMIQTVMNEILGI